MDRMSFGDFTYGRNCNGEPLFLHSCQYWLVRHSDAVKEVLDAYMWFDKSSLSIAYPNGITLALKRAIENYHYGLNEGRREKMEKENDRRKQESARSFRSNSR